ncbi:glycosyltransferase [Nocardiopsis aegyptia]|uniref:Glycosyltransferase involved in cell wall biosynthesis n=1 Tax=Nocardiopsis aegyptia TaxID=220378 RepID=A0A7Z0ELJ1_9ACTN|nr:glycosyltransferase [Nocardiopsis aegyptia]NYJ34312.1 glycosyltransferase involved in cell wall biosynthesis [Nocardiopsis aegyptia]
MKIAMVAEHANPLPAHRGEPACPASLHVCALSRQLAKRGHKVTVYARRSSPDQPDGRTRMARGVSVTYLDAGPGRPLASDEQTEHTGAFGTALARALDEDAPDVLHAVGWTSGLAALHAQAHTGRDHATTPIVQTFHSLNASEQRSGLAHRPDRARMESVLASRVDHVLVNSTDQQGELARLGVPRQQVSVVPFGVDTDHFSVEGSASTEHWQSRREERPRLVSVTSLTEAGGADRLVEAMTRLPEAELLLVSTADDLDVALDENARRVELLAKEAGVDDRVHLTGPVDRKELPRLLRSADVYVSAASYDPYGGAVLEAMACGLPVVATATGAVPGAVLHRTSGVLIRFGRPEEVARAVRAVLHTPTMSSAYGIAAVDRARSRFTWQRIAIETEIAYQRSRPQQVEHDDDEEDEVDGLLLSGASH